MSAGWHGGCRRVPCCLAARWVEFARKAAVSAGGGCLLCREFDVDEIYHEGRAANKGHKGSLEGLGLLVVFSFHNEDMLAFEGVGPSRHLAEIELVDCFGGVWLPRLRMIAHTAPFAVRSV